MDDVVRDVNIPRESAADGVGGTFPAIPDFSRAACLSVCLPVSLPVRLAVRLSVRPSLVRH